ncbi:hypothetical protein ACFORO_17125 [Amycolatopsis halotolerans]|uniref:Uncharacterized protein n=1 Tax=Amycolatopsis halotolerans TaxID=330083 RepID=A0ABV7QIU5_9PSEU
MRAGITGPVSAADVDSTDYALNPGTVAGQAALVVGVSQESGQQGGSGTARARAAG